MRGLFLLTLFFLFACGRTGSPIPPADPPLPPAAVVAFPGAEGFGAAAVGGRGGIVLFVENRNDSGPGSLREAIDTPGPRTVVFRVSGTIELESSLRVNEPYLTIAGQTAPGGGIALKNSGSFGTSVLQIRTNDVVIRYLRIRSGPDSTPGGSQNNDCVSITAGAERVILDHCSLSWAVDETMSIFDTARDITIQWCILSEGLYCSNHLKTVSPEVFDTFGDCPAGGVPHSRGMTISTAPGAVTDPRNITLHHNLWAHFEKRFPNLTSRTNVDYVNNVIYNFESAVARLGAKNPGGLVELNYVANWIRSGPDTLPGGRFFYVDIDEASPAGEFSVYLEGNDVVAPELLPDVPAYWADKGWPSAVRHKAPPVTEQTAVVAYDLVLADAGATLPARDVVDARIVAEVQAGTGGLIDHPDDVGGWPLLASAPAPVDADRDGMSDAWETVNGLDPTDSTDGPTDRDGDGYTNLEEYLNGSVP